MLTKSRVVQLLVMMLILLFMFFWKTFDSDQESEKSSGEEVVQQSELIRCDYRTPCEFITEQGTYYLSVEDLPIKAEEWIHFELDSPLENLNISKAQIVGKSMFMGRIPVTFKASSKTTFLAKTLVGSCTTEKMIWTLEIYVENAGKEVLLAFDFMIKR